MTYGSKPRPVSDLARSLLAVLVLLVAGIGGADRAVARTVVVRGEAAGRNDIQAWVREDRQWLKSLSASVPTLETVPLDSLEAGHPAAWEDLRRRVGAAAPGDTLPALRTADSLLRDRWVDRAHLSARVTVRSDTFFVDPGPVWTIGRFEIEGPEFPGREHLLGTWLPREGDRFLREELAEGVGQVLRGAGETGYPFARWVAREAELEPVSATVTLRARLLPGNRAWIGPVTSDLPTGRSADFLARAAGIRTGEQFRQSELDRAVQRLLARDLYTTVGTPAVYLTSAADTVGIHFPVVPRRKTNRLQVVLGLSRNPEDGTSNLSGEVDLNLPDMAGTGRGLRVGWRDDGFNTSRFGFSYLEPLIFGTPLDMGLGLDNEVDRDSYTRFRLDNIWRLPVVALWGIEVGLGWDRATYPEGTVESTSRTRARGAVSHRRGDRTRSGWEGLFAIETAWRSSTLRPADDPEAVTSSQLAEAVTQRIFEGDSSGELMLSGTLSLFARASFRQLTGGDPIVPLAEQFRFGGAASLRGYREDEFHGSLAAWGGVEARIGRPLGSRLYTFYDLGYFEFKTVDPLDPTGQDLLKVQGWPKGYGLGLLARTRAGDISLAVGFPGTVDFDQAKLHVTLLESF
jgi:outer membrane protein insertion porin family